MKPRWELRFENFSRVLGELEAAIVIRASRPMNDLEAAGTIKRFEMCFELGWKVLQDFVADSGAPLDIRAPKYAIRAGLAANLIVDGDGWIEAMKLRNRTTHEYSSTAAMAAIEEIEGRHLPLFQALRQKLDDQRA